jgi:hypothetical protein
MSKLYVPILRAKEGELIALDKLSNIAKKGLTPLLDIAMQDDGSELSVSVHLSKVAAKIGNVWADNTIYLDMFNWAPDATSENGQHVLLEMWKYLESHSVRTNVILGFDRWEDDSYKLAIKNILSMAPRRTCLRLDLDAIRDIRSPDFFEEALDSIFDYLNLDSNAMSVLLDIEDITHMATVDIYDEISFAINYLESHGFNEIILAGSSVPAFVTDIVKKENSSALISRKEMILWKMLISDGNENLIFGDYGVRNPKSSGKGYGNTNGKIRYTIENQLFVVRGHNLTKPPKGKQYYALATKVVNSPYYEGANFSWGDSKILDCSNEKFIGNSTNWISVDTNHHIEYVLKEIKLYKSVSKEDLVTETESA